MGNIHVKLFQIRSSGSEEVLYKENIYTQWKMVLWGPF